MIKTASQAAAQTDVLARTDARTFDERPHMRKEPFCARFSRKTSGFRMGGALRERPRREAMRSFNHTSIAEQRHVMNA